jgi:uncharacterized membrane protein SpoIIM required for sporulation
LVPTRKVFSVLIHFSWVAVLMAICSVIFTIQTLYFLVLPISFYLGYYICTLKKNWQANLITIIWLLSIWLSSYFT